MVGHGPGHGQVQVEDDGQVHEDDVLRGEVEVVHHRRPGHLDRPGDHQLARGICPVVGEIRGLRYPVAEEVQLPGDRAHLRVRGHRGAQLPAEVVCADRVQVAGEFVGQGRLDQGEGPARVPDDVGVGRARGEVAVALVVVGPGPVGETTGAYPAVAVRDGPAALQPDAVDHAVAEEPVSGGGVGRVRPVAEVPAGQLGRDPPRHRQVVRGEFFADRGVVARQVGPGLLRGGHRAPALAWTWAT